MDFRVASDLPESFSALTDFDFWADTLEERAVSKDWCEKKALVWNEKLQARLDLARGYPALTRAFSSFFYCVAMQYWDVDKDVTLCLEVARLLRKFTFCREEKMILKLVRKALKKTTNTYMQAYEETEDRRRIYKDALTRLESPTGINVILKRALMVKAKKAASHLAKCIELEQSAKFKMFTAMQKYEYLCKRVAVKKSQYFLDIWKAQLSRYIEPCSTSTEKSVRNPYLDVFMRVLGVNAHDVVDASFDCNTRIFKTLPKHSNTSTDVDMKKVLAFESKLSSMTQKSNDRKSYLEYSGLADSVFVPPDFKWHEFNRNISPSLVISDWSAPIKQQVTVSHDHKSGGKHEFTCKKGMMINQLTDANELGLALGIYERTFPFPKSKIGFFPVKCVSSEPRQVLKNSCRWY